MEEKGDMFRIKIPFKNRKDKARHVKMSLFM